ncbi:hypothetical protein SK128_000264 [Halocaridina rubra]|uniref:Uncharacterized protein n=1 Tax=Halocaridina rubra TaxID=373956 RepID=A0AAN9AGA3_HALRR
MRKDLPSMIEQDKRILGEDEDESEREAALLSGEKYREKLHQKWEREEAVNTFKKDLHYQDIMFDEARLHGTGYMKFSQNEEERKAQMNLLKQFHNEAEVVRKAQKNSAATKQKLLQKRLEKVRQRKRLKLGLPIKGMHFTF